MGLFNFLKAKKIIKNWSENSIVIFSEGNVYNTTNKPVIDELIKDIDVLYITIDKDELTKRIDEVLEHIKNSIDKIANDEAEKC